MRAAAPKTYISSRMINKYSEQRLQQQQARSEAAGSGNTPPVIPAKTFAEDSNTSAAAQDSTNLAVIEESKQEFENTNAVVVEAA